MNLKYEVGQTVKVEANKTVVELMESEIKSITVCSTGAKYLTSKGAFSEEQLDAFALKAQPIAPQEDKARFKVGQKVKVIGNCCCHGYSRGTILTLVRSVNFLRREPDWCVGEGTDYVSERDIEPYAEPEQPKEAVKLYCVKDYVNWRGAKWLTTGKTYVFENGSTTLDEGNKTVEYGSFSTFSKFNPTMSACLVPLVKRPAKVGEWVLVTNAVAPNGEYKNGDLFQVIRKWSNGINVGKPFDMFDSEYEVLNNYHPEPEKEPEPVYYSGKVVCVEANSRFFTMGKTYKFKDGKVCADDGRCLPENSPAVKTLSEFMETKNIISKFIPYLGEA